MRLPGPGSPHHARLAGPGALQPGRTARHVSAGRSPAGGERDRSPGGDRDEEQQRLAEAGIEPSIDSVGNSYDSALAKSVIGLFKTKVIRCEAWRQREAVEFATLERVDRFNNRRLIAPIGNILPPTRPRNATMSPRRPLH